MSNLTSALIVVLSINCILFLGQMAVLDISADAPNFYNCQGTIFGQLESSACASSIYVLNDTNPSSRLPSGETSVSPETGNIFTDAFTSIKSFFINDLGLGYLVAILSAPSNFLKALGLPSAFTFAIGALWYGLTLFLLIAFFWGRDA